MFTSLNSTRTNSHCTFICLFFFLCSNKCLFMNLDQLSKMRLETFISNSKTATFFKWFQLKVFWGHGHIFYMREINLEWSKIWIQQTPLKRQASFQRVARQSPFNENRFLSLTQTPKCAHWRRVNTQHKQSKLFNKTWM